MVSATAPDLGPCEDLKSSGLVCDLIWLNVICVQEHVDNVIHIPATGFMLFCWSTVGEGNTLKKLAMCQQRQGRGGELPSNYWFKTMQDFFFKEFCTCFMRREMHSACLSVLKHTHHAFGWGTVNVNIILFPFLNINLHENSMGHL